MAEFGANAIKRATILSLISRAVELGQAETLEEAYDVAFDVLTSRFEEDGILSPDEVPKQSKGNSRGRGGSGNRGSRGRSGSSRGKGSRSRSGNSKGDFQYKNPDAPATDGQIDKAIAEGAIEDGYSEDDLADMTMAEIGGLIEELLGN